MSEASLTLLVVGSIITLGSGLFDITDLGDGLGGIGAGLTGAGWVLYVNPSAPVAAMMVAISIVVACWLVNRLLGESATGPVAELETLIGSELVLLTPTDAQGRGATASVTVGGVGNVVLVDAERPLEAGRRVWVRSISDHGSRVAVDPID